LEEESVERRMILTWMLKKSMREYTGSDWFRISFSSCKYCSERRSIFLSADLIPASAGLWPMELGPCLLVVLSYSVLFWKLDETVAVYKLPHRKFLSSLLK
jgi:hypothetical protein